MPRYWLYLDSKVQGPYEIPHLRKVPGFTLLTQVCAENDPSWRLADEVIDIKAYFLAPPRASSVFLDSGNAAAAPQAWVEETPSALSLVEPRSQEALDASTAASPAVQAEEPPVERPGPGPQALRLSCEVCGYKNPRDVASCMKCGTTLHAKTGAEAAAAPESAAPVESPAPAPVMEEPAAPMPAAEASAPFSIPAPESRPSATVDIPVARILFILTAVSVLAGAGFMGYRFWKARRGPKVPPAASLKAPPAASAAGPVRSSVRKGSGGKRAAGKKAPAVSSPGAGPSAPRSDAVGDESDSTPLNAEPALEAASYEVIPGAAPRQQRHSAPLHSPYAIKRRGDRGLWTGREDQAVQQAQRFRIYGGQRTIQRNAEILMQILRDREYNAAFENGKRIYLYNDLDWSATQKDGPLYDVRLTFSGGREEDGAPKKPLRFALEADLERGSVDPSAEEPFRSNTLHAFFDESRIPPQERRAIAKDVEELVLAAQPDASPLALDTVARRFASTYSTGAMARVAGAFNLDLVNKKLVHDPRLNNAAAPAKPLERPAIKKKTALTPSQSGQIVYQMESLSGRERRLSLQAPSRASVSKLWETVTGYDRLKQFAPDLLVSEREGQDGSATIVHVVSLSRLLFFVFKVNLHLRIIERPQEHALEFERIAGEFRSFRGSVQISPQGSSGSTLQFRATVIPQGRMPNWVLRDMTKRFLVPLIDALRARAESL